jgi:hypothetical protein
LRLLSIEILETPTRTLRLCAGAGRGVELYFEKPHGTEEIDNDHRGRPGLRLRPGDDEVFHPEPGPREDGASREDLAVHCSGHDDLLDVAARYRSCLEERGERHLREECGIVPERPSP